MKKVLVPKVRFKGFSEEWKEERFGDTIEPYRLKNDNKEKLTSYSISNKFGFVNQKEFFENGGKAIRADKSNSLVVFPNSFAYNPARIDVGSIGLYTKEEKCLVSPIYEVFKTDKKMNDEFLFNWFKTDEFKWIVNKSKEGSVRNTVYLRNISDYLINITSYIEQQKISKLLDYISNLINLEEIKLNKLKQLKETLLQKMFPEGNSKTPRIRFKVFEEEWKEEKLEDIFKVITGGEPPKNYKNSKHPVGKYKYPIYSNGQEANAIWGFSDNYSINTEAITISSIGTIGFPVVRKMFFTPIIRLKTLLPYNKNMNINFLNLSVSQINFSFNQAGIPSMNSNQLKDNIVLISRNFSEQQKIGDFFCKIDTLLDLYQSKLNKLRQIKEALLQKMFV
ncbi:restriction endonuclease subunit S [Mycoplasmopsis felis]|uniref:restriction endonuclease subunit S n=1 Tax=Mycoplasmopsis felis TaxID=33923 RepID=UPI002AF6B176|nr:restriction endonuclease subunit S [Mycoplasmopsis felis]WQQ02447.1 restriction endonuclease subunit S [Mycoplasmopsis felis]